MRLGREGLPEHGGEVEDCLSHANVANHKRFASSADEPSTLGVPYDLSIACKGVTPG